MNQPVRVRFAPSPTGFPHVGNIRTALFNWLFARHSGGAFIVRIEDTDVARKVEGALDAILDGLRWLGLDWDEGPEVGGKYGPYFQSQRLDLYREAADRLVEQGDAYRCYCSPERMAEMRAEQQKRKQSPGYDRRCRDLSETERTQKEAEGITPVVRFKMPLEGQASFSDIIWGEITVENSLLDDYVLLKSDGYPTYHLANVVDDHLMEISHVLRAEEWLSSVPRHKLLYQALGYEMPQLAHLPMILGPDRSKLSKRHGAVSIIEYREQGYLPEAMVSFLALLGWSLDDKTDIIARDDLVKHFSLERISKTAAIFNHEKLDWMNGVFLRELSHEELLRKIMPFLESGLPEAVKRPVSEEYVSQIVPLVRERINTLAEAATYADFFFLDELEYDASLLMGKKMTVEITLKALKVAQERLSLLESFDHDSLEGTLRPLAEELGLKTGQLFSPLRVATTGRTAAPPLFETMMVLGKERCLERIRVAVGKLGNN
ncbi:MAG: glutamate--tRNA ligase [Dehalococcoidales bacterium]|nr:glutamate--tRNA ligase [Dehalococcoidales bacterium]